MNTTDMSKTTAPKSDQLNFDDFITGPKNITISKVDISSNKDEQQPAIIHYQGDDGHPYKPCKTMRRVIVQIWGKESTNYVGKSMTLYGDKTVKWGGKPVGGIRISHMSHMDEQVQVSVSLSKGKRAPHLVKPLHIEMEDPDPVDNEDEPYEALHQRAKEQASNGTSHYQDFFMSQTAADKTRLKESGDHDKLKILADAVTADPKY